MRVYIKGKSWKIVFTNMKRGLIGDCTDPNLPHRTIRINRNSSQLHLLEAVCHEVVHANCWDLSEETVEELGESLAKILHKLGARITVPEK